MATRVCERSPDEACTTGSRWSGRRRRCAPSRPRRFCCSSDPALAGRCRSCLDPLANDTSVREERRPREAPDPLLTHAAGQDRLQPAEHSLGLKASHFRARKTNSPSARTAGMEDEEWLGNQFGLTTSWSDARDPDDQARRRGTRDRLRLNASSSGRHDDATVVGVATYSEKAAAGGESG